MKKLLLIVATLLCTVTSFAQFTGIPDNNVRMFVKGQYTLKSSLAENMKLCHEGNAILNIQNVLSNHWSFDVGFGLWYGNDWNKECGTDFFIGLTYSTGTPVYTFINFHPRFHMQHEDGFSGVIDDAFSLYGFSSFGCGGTVKLVDNVHLYGETGFSFNFSTRLTATSDSKLLNDVQLFASVGILLRNF